MDDLVVETRPAEHLIVLRLNRPQARNAFNDALLHCLAERLSAAKNDSSVRAVVITGSDKAFGAGGDLREMAATSPVGLWRSPRHDWWGEINRFTKPIIAAVNGPAFGGGCELSLACDIVVAADSATFALPEIKLGFVPGRGGTQRLPGLIGKSAAMHMILTGEPISADDALRLGMVWEVCKAEETVARAIAIAERIAKHAPVAVSIGKELVQRACPPMLEQGMALERHCYEFLTGTDDAREGMDAFLNKRTPRFNGE